VSQFEPNSDEPWHEHYIIVEKDIGKGAFASIHRAKNIDTNEIVALKSVTEKPDPLTFDRLRREAEILQTLDSAHVVSVLHFDTTGHRFDATC
jgi:serine/threonine protein kinase